MQGTPFTIKTFLFDILVSVAAFIVAFFIGGISILLVTWSEEAPIQIYFIIIIILWTIIFYLIRRRFSFKTTLLQMLFTSIITYGLSYLIVELLIYLSTTYKFDIAMVIPYFAVLAFILSKHISDRYIIRKNLAV